MSINHAVISGNLVRDAEVKFTNGGMAVCKFTVAVNERRKGASGEWEDYASYIDVTLFGTRGEKLGPIMTKGKFVVAEGRLRQRRWEAKDGTKRSAIELVADEVDLGPKVASHPRTASPDLFDSDVPF